jgi:hypothetical protein
MSINIERRDHEIFQGLAQDMFRLWSDYTNFDETKPGFPAIYPVTNGYLMRDADFGQVTLYANYSRNLTGVALCEINHGRGSVILSGFDLTSRCGIDPVAKRFFANLITYAASWRQPEPHMIVDRPIIWGDYESEAGIVTGANNGLVLNPYPIVPSRLRDELKLKVDARGYHYVNSYGGWNTRPGVQYVTRGRRPFAPFGYTLGGNDLVRGKDEARGTGYFLAKVPGGKTKMLTIFENNSEFEIKTSLQINNDRVQEFVITPKSQLKVESPLPKEKNIKVIISGDRRTVLLRTEFI